jgi:hypothetical protein
MGNSRTLLPNDFNEVKVKIDDLEIKKERGGWLLKWRENEYFDA